MSEQSEETTLNQLTLFAGDFRVRICRLPDDGRVLVESGRGYGSSLRGLLANLRRDGLWSRTYPAFYPAQAGGTLPSSFEGWSSGGMAWPGGYLTLNTSDWPSAAAVCSLSDILETDAHPRYSLSPTAARGILRRAEKRGRNYRTCWNTRCERWRNEQTRRKRQRT